MFLREKVLTYDGKNDEEERWKKGRDLIPSSLIQMTNDATACFVRFVRDSVVRVSVVLSNVTVRR